VAQVFASVRRDEAIVVKSLLESAGIAAELLEEGMLDARPFFAAEIKGARVLVRDEDEEDAKAVVADFTARKTGA